jgi:hypothetical protein
MRSVLSTFFVLGLALTAGCKQHVLCPALGSCGSEERDANGHSVRPLSLTGDVQEWVLAPGHESCEEDLYIPANDTRLSGMTTLPTTGTMTPWPEPALFDWCLLLVAGPGDGDTIQRKDPRFYYESGQIGVASVKYKPDNTFSADLTYTGTFTLDFPSYCVRAFGAMDAPLDPSVDPNTVVPVCKRLQVPLAADGVGGGDYFNTTCEANTDEERIKLGLDGPADPGGCLCTFNVTETAGPVGTYGLLDDSTILHVPGHNDTLQLTGTDGAYLFDKKGLRTFDLVRGCQTGADCKSGNCNFNMKTFTGYCQ